MMDYIINILGRGKKHLKLFIVKQLILFNSILVGNSCFAYTNFTEYDLSTFLIKYEILLKETNDNSNEKTTIIQPYIQEGTNRLNLKTCETDGAEPKLLEAFLYQNKNFLTQKIVVLCEWNERHVAADIEGKRFRVFIYDYTNHSIKERVDIEKLFEYKGLYAGEGFDGNNSGVVSTFKYQNRKSIEQKLNYISHLYKYR